MRYTDSMVIQRRIFLGTVLASITLHAAAGAFYIAGGVGIYYGSPLVHGIHDSWLGCTSPYRCGDPIQLRLQIERYRRLQELRERATPSEPRIYGLDTGPWGPQRYIPPPTPEATIQPAYRATSRLWPEYEQSVQPIGEPTKEPLK